MAKTLQRFENDAVSYNRPNLNWVCGHVCDGKACALGPDKRGSCRGGAECIPMKQGDRWTCARSADYGGPCAEGPSPEGECCRPLAHCSPERTLRAKRKLAVLLAVAITAGLILIFIVGSAATRDAMLNPGPLTASHAGANMNCAACHGADLALTDSIHQRAVDMNQNCLSCHANIAGNHEESTGFAHGLPPELLAELSGKSSEDRQQLLIRLAGNASPVIDAGANGTLACATCHQEHHGQQASLTVLTDQQCQICHQKQFESFAHGHPNFNETDYPFWQRTRIHFDHESHYGGHFAEKADRAPAGFDEATPFAESASCRTCHVTDDRGMHMRLVGYEQSCGACHEDAVRGGNPIPFLTLPHEPHHDHTEETEHGMGVPPVLLAALSEDSRQALLAKHEESPDGMVQLAAEDLDGPIMAEIREFHHAVWENGPAEFENRLRENGWIIPEESGSLFAGMSLDSVRQFLFPGTQFELGDLAFPELDVDALNAHLAASNRSIGLWPERARAPLTPLMRHLLEPRETAANALRAIDADPDFDLGDLSSASAAELDATAILAWEIKELFHLIQERGAPFLQQFVSLQGGILEVGGADQVMDSVFFMARSDDAFMAGHHAEIMAYHAGQHPPKIRTEAASPGDGATPSSSGGDDDFGSDSDDDFGSDPKPKPAAADDDFGSDSDDDFGSDPKPKPKPAAADDDFGSDSDDDDFGAETKKIEADHDHEDHPDYQFSSRPRRETGNAGAAGFTSIFR